MKRVFYSYIGPNESRWIVDDLRQEAGWEPVLFHGLKELGPWAASEYPAAKMVDSTELRRGYFDYSGIGAMQTIDAGVVAKLAPFESNYLSWLEDTTGWNFSFHERRRYYYDMLNFWHTAIRQLKPDIFVAYTWPHLPSDYALYLLCKYYFEIPVLFLDAYPQLDQYYYTVGTSLEDLSAPFLDYYETKDKPRLSPDVAQYLTRLRAPDPRPPKHITKYYSLLASLDAHRLRRYLKLLLQTVTGRAFRPTGEAFKKGRAPMGTPQAFLNVFESFFFWERLTRDNLALKKVYDRLTEAPVPGENYIYFAAPYQPEAISNLIPGVYEDPFLLLDVLSAALPKGWKIYYKEHPGTFSAMSKGSLSRDRHYYERLRRYENVRIMSTSLDTFRLLDGSRGVATAGGTVGWEAVARGKPSFLFGSMWYEKCKSVFSIKTVEDAREAFRKIEAGFTPDPSDVECYAEAVYRACDKGLVTVVNFAELIRAAKDPRHEMNRVATAFKKAYQRLYRL